MSELGLSSWYAVLKKSKARDEIMIKNIIFDLRESIA